TSGSCAASTEGESAAHPLRHTCSGDAACRMQERRRWRRVDRASAEGAKDGSRTREGRCRQGEGHRQGRRRQGHGRQGTGDARQDGQGEGRHGQGEGRPPQGRRRCERRLPQGDRRIVRLSVEIETKKAALTGGFLLADTFCLGPEWCCRTGLNCRPLPYQGSALPLSYGSGENGRAPTRPRRTARKVP